LLTLTHFGQLKQRKRMLLIVHIIFYSVGYIYIYIYIFSNQKLKSGLQVRNNRSQTRTYTVIFALF